MLSFGTFGNLYFYLSIFGYKTSFIITTPITSLSTSIPFSSYLFDWILLKLLFVLSLSLFPVLYTLILPILLKILNSSCNISIFLLNYSHRNLIISYGISSFLWFMISFRLIKDMPFSAFCQYFLPVRVRTQTGLFWKSEEYLTLSCLKQSQCFSVILWTPLY